MRLVCWQKYFVPFLEYADTQLSKELLFPPRSLTILFAPDEHTDPVPAAEISSSCYRYFSRPLFMAGMQQEASDRR